MALVLGLNDLSDSLIKVGSNLVKPHSSTPQLLSLLDEAESLLRTIGQDQPLSILNALVPTKDGLVTDGLLNHSDSDVKVSVVSCLTEILRITAPDAPYNDDQMKEIFRLTIEAFEKLADLSSRSYKKVEAVLDNMSRVRSCLVMLDLECYDIILQMFRNFLRIIRSDHSQVVFTSMEMIMITTIDEIETEDVFQDLVDVLLASVKKENQAVSPRAWSLAEKVLSRCGSRLQPLILEALKSTGTSLDMYSPVVKTICESVHDVVNTEETEAAESELEKEVALSDDALEENLDSGNAHKGIRSKSRSKRPVRDGTVRINVNGNNSSLLKEDESELGVSGKRGRKPNSLMNPEDYDISWLSGKRASVRTSSNTKLPKKGSGGGESSRGKKRPLPKETSPATTSRTLKRSRVKIDESDHDLDSLSSPRLKKLASCFREKESNQEKSDEIPEEDERKIGTSSKRTRSQNGLERSQRSAQKKPIVEAKIVNSSVKRTSDGRIIRSKTATWDSIAQRKNAIKVPESSKSKKMVSQVAEESEETSKSHSTKRQKTRKEVESEKKTFGKDLVGRRVKIWWPLDKKYYEGVVESYSTRKKTHLVLYLDGDSEELNLVEQRWKLLEDEDHTSANEEDMEIDLPESVPLIDIMRRQKLQKCKNVEPASSSGVRSSGRIVTKKGSGKKGKKQAKRGKGGSKIAAVKPLKELSTKIETTEEEDDDNERDGSEKQEQSEGKSEEESLKLSDTEAETKEEEKQSPNSEAASERDGSGSEEEPKWRETDVMEDEGEEKKEEMVDDKGKNSSSSEREKEEDEDRDMEAEVEERVEVNGTNMSENEKEADDDRDVKEVNDKGTNTSLSVSEKEGDDDKEMEDVADEREDVTDKEGEKKDVENEAEERDEMVDDKVTKSELEKEGGKKDMENEAEESDETVNDKVTKSDLEKEEAEDREEVDDKVTKTNLPETEKVMEDEAEEKEKMMVDDKVTSTSLSEIEKHEAEEKKET